MSTSVATLTDNFFPSAENGFTTTTSGSVSSGAATVGLNSVAGYSNGEVAVFVIDPADPTKKQTFTGVVDTSGSQITSVVWTAGSNTTHVLGATVVDYATATHISMISKGLLVEHNQDGTHATNMTVNTNNATLTSPKVITGINDTNGNELLKVTATSSAVNELTLANAATGNAPSLTASGGDTNISVNVASKGTGEVQVNGVAMSGAWQDWTPTLTNIAVGTGGSANLTAKYKQIGKTVHFKILLVLGTSGASVGASHSFTLPVTATAALTSGNSSMPIGTAWFEDNGTKNFQGSIVQPSTTTGRFLVHGDNSTTYESAFGISSTAPHTWAAGDVLYGWGTYEAA